MPRRKQDNPQHFEEEMKMEQLLSGDGAEFERGLRRVETIEKNKTMSHRPRVDDMKLFNGGIDVAEDLSSLSSRDPVSRVEDTRPAVIANQEWQEVQATLSSLQQQMQILRVQQLQLMQLLASQNQDGSNLSTTNCESLEGASSAEKPETIGQTPVDQPSPDVTSAEESRQEQQNHTPMKQDGGDLATAPMVDLDEEDGKSLDTPTANGELETTFDLGIPAVNEETGEPMSFDCTHCSAVLPSPELLRLHQLSHEKRDTSQASTSVATTPTDSLPISSSQPLGTLGSLPPSYQSIINDLSNDSLEEYMEIQKPENTHLEQLVKNMDGTVTDPNQCLICKRILSCKSALMMHYRTHTGERPFKCKLCSRAFTTKGNLKTHMGVHRAKPPLRLLHNCVICNKAFTNALVLNQHMKQHSDENSRKRNYDVQSSISGEECKRQRTLFNPDSSYKEEPAADNTFDLVTRAMTAPDMHTLPSVSIGSAPFPFDFPGVPSIPDPLRYAEIFARQFDQFGHYPMLPPIPPMKPPMFPGALGLPVSMGLPFPAGLPSLPKPSIRTPFPFESGPEETANKAAKPKQPEVEIVETEPETSQNEKISFEPSSGLNNSPKSERSWGSGELPSNGSSGFKLDPPPGTTCDICLKSFACRSALEIHYRSHTKHRPFKCDLCDKAFTTRGNMKQHILTHKSDEVQWNGGDNPLIQPSVPSPPSTEFSPSSEDAKKTGSKHQCSVCLKYFSSASAVQIHFRTHTGDRPFKCSICGKAFTTKGNLKVHMGTHIWNGTTPITSVKSDASEMPSEVRKDIQEDESASATSPGRANLTNNNSFNWNPFSQPSSLTKSPFLTSSASVVPNYNNMFGQPGGLPPPLSAEEQPKPWAWHLTCVVCHREMPSSAALEMHMKSHMVNDSGPSKPLATLQLT